jgi:hypothetical protein
MSTSLYYWRRARSLLARAMMRAANALLDLAEAIAPEDIEAKP